MLALGVDTSNYATSLAVVDTAGREVVCALKRFLPVKPGETGLRQSDAVFHHTTALPQLLEELSGAVDLSRIRAVGVSARPRPVEGSYMPCFLAGASFAAAFAAGRGAPLVETSHQQGHLASALLGAGGSLEDAGELLFFHVSGGTTELLLANGYHIAEQLGGSLDLYAGQAVDRLGVRLGHHFPAGVHVSEAAARCPEADTIRPKISVQGMDCHLSGLQNQCEALLAQGRDEAYVCAYCLAAIADTIAAMIGAARKTHPKAPVLCAGGVMSSGLIRKRLEKSCGNLHFAPPELSSDNAVGVALIAGKEACHG